MGGWGIAAVYDKKLFKILTVFEKTGIKWNFPMICGGGVGGSFKKYLCAGAGHSGRVWLGRQYEKHAGRKSHGRNGGNK